MLTAIKTGTHVEIKKIVEFINRCVAERGKPDRLPGGGSGTWDVFHAIQNKYLDDFKAAMDTDDKNVRTQPAAHHGQDRRGIPRPVRLADLGCISYKMQKFVVRRWLLDEPGRPWHQRRPPAGRRGGHPAPVHGSGMFTRGQTQVLYHLHAGRHQDNQLMDDLDRRADQARYIHHYNFPPYSVGGHAHRAAPAAARSATAHWPSVLWCRCCPP